MSRFNIADEFFPELEHFGHWEIFKGIERPWDVLAKIEDYLLATFPAKKANGLPSGIKQMKGADEFLICTAPVVLKKDLVFKPLKIVIGAGTKIEPTALIKGPTIIGKNCDIRHGAYLRGGLLCGDTCTLGHTTEIKNSVIMNHSEMGHFNYIGDCVIGSYVNLGAGTKLANLKFRAAAAKMKVSFPEISFLLDGKKVKTGRSKLGAVIGDHCELGCNSVTSPAVLLGHECWVMPNMTVTSGYYKPKTFLRP
ncbi:MAG: glucose-1-phosphate thymidylyltransferase [Nitrospinae bacterium]|nr:glucose-1-phosphate thymidylyltransferase [Nitrospinota bacterium]